MNDLTIVSPISRGSFSSSFTICEVDEMGNRDAFEDVEVQHDSGASNDAEEIDQFLRELAKSRGLELA